MTRRLRAALWGLLLVAVSFSPSKASAALVIDSFGEPQLRFVFGTGTDFDFVAGAMLGGERDVFVEVAEATGSAAVQTGPADLVVSSSRAYSSYTYDGVDGSPAVASGLAGLDLTEGGTANAFVIDFVAIDNPADFHFDVFSAAGVSRVTFNGTAGLSGSFFLPFSGLAPTVGSGADLTAVDALRFTIDGLAPSSDNLDVTIAEIGTTAVTAAVPEPGSAALFALASLSFGLRHRRKSEPKAH